MSRLLSRLEVEGKIASSAVESGFAAIPLRRLPRTAADRLLALGEVAGQVKPTTGGGIWFGHLGARTASRVLREALASDNLAARQLSRYQKEWKAKMGKELSRGYWARWTYSGLSDRQIEGVFKALESDGTASALLSSDGFSFDWHSKLISSVLRHSSAYPCLRVRHLFSREVSS